jgi:hypothetical protein
VSSRARAAWRLRSARQLELELQHKMPNLIRMHSRKEVNLLVHPIVTEILKKKPWARTISEKLQARGYPRAGGAPWCTIRQACSLSSAASILSNVQRLRRR